MTTPPRWYRALLLLFPQAFRSAYGLEMERLFGERWRETAGSAVRRVGLVAAAVLDVATGAAAEWWSLLRRAVAELSTEGMGVGGWRADLRFGVRGLLRRPGFTVAAVSTLALGIGATLAIFSVVNGVLLKPLPYPDPDAIVVLWNTDVRDGSHSHGMDHPDIRIWQEEVDGLSVAGYAGIRPTLTGLGEPEVIQGVRVTNGLMEVLGVAPALGRDLEAADDVHGGARVVVISHGFWRDRLGADPEVLGRPITLDGEPWEIVGVAPDGFDFPNGALLWTPARHDASYCGHGCRFLNAVGRIHPGSTLAGVQERMDATSARLAEDFPDSHRDFRTTFERLLDTRVADVRTALWVLMGSVVMVLLIACANVANLLLVRGRERAEEMALRATLGASRVRLVRQLLTESLLLAVAGGLLGVALATWGVDLLVGLAPDGIPRMEQVGLDGPVLGLAFLTVAAVTLIFGLAPALQLARRPLRAALGGGRRASGERGQGLSRTLLLSGEVALSLMLLLGAGLLLGTLRQIRATDLGFDAEQVERFRVSLPESRYDTPAVIRFFEELDASLAARPEIDAAGSAFGAPLASGNITTSVELTDRDPVPPADQPDVALRPANPGYLEAMRIPLLRGRWFAAWDRWESEAVAVINQAAARALWPGEDPMGKRIRMGVSWGFDEDPERTVVGIVGDARTRELTEPDEPTVYVPNAQFGVEVMYVTMRLARSAPSGLPAAREVVRAMDPDLALYNVARMEEVVSAEMAPTRFYLSLIGAFSVLALVLASVGLYGVVAYAVSRRTREIGIRVALGAEGGAVVGMVLREGMAPTVLGVLAGLGGSLAGGRAIRALLYGVEPNDPLVVASVTLLLLGVTLLATFLPARRAARIPPSTALRAE